MTALWNVAVSMRTADGSNGEVYDAVSDDLVAFIADAGFTPVVLPNRPSVAQRLLTNSGGLILSGGAEIVGGDTGVSHRRFDTERELIRLALARQLPVLGVCRGAQVINDWFGGEIRAISPAGGHVAAEHPVRVLGRQVGSLLEPFESLVVNSFHRDGIARLGAGVEVGAVAPDGQIEAIEHETFPVVGLMWHPERACSDARFKQLHSDALRRLLVSGSRSR